MIYPSLTFTALLLLPLGALCNYLKRRFRFDWPAATSQAEQQGGTGQQPALTPKFA